MYRNRFVFFVISLILIISLIACNGVIDDSDVTSKDTSSEFENPYEGLPEEKYILAGKPVPFQDLDLGGESIIIASWWDPKPADKGTSELADRTWERIEYLEETYNCKFEFLPMVEAEMIAQITTSVEAGNPVFDFGYVLNSSLPMLSQRGYLQVLDEMEAFDLSEPKWPAVALDAGRFNSKHYSFEMQNFFYPRQIMLWNKTMFEDNGWPNLYDLMDSGEWTFDKMLEIAKLATRDLTGDGTDDVHGFIGYGDLYGSQVLLSNNASLVDFDDTGRPVFAADSDNAIEAFNFLLDLKYKYEVINEPELPSWDQYIHAFRRGRVAMLFTELYMVNNLTDMDDDFGVIVAPKGPRADTYSSRSGWFGVVTMLANNPLKQEKAFIFDLFTEPYPGLEDAWKTGFETFLRDEKSIENVRTISENYSEIDWSFYYPEARELIGDAMNAAWFGEMTYVEAMDSIRGAVQSILDDYHEDIFD